MPKLRVKRADSRVRKQVLDRIAAGEPRPAVRPTAPPKSSHRYGVTGELVDHFFELCEWIIQGQPHYADRERGHGQVVGRWIKQVSADDLLIDNWARSVKLGQWRFLGSQSFFQSLVGYRKVMSDRDY